MVNFPLSLKYIESPSKVAKKIASSKLTAKESKVIREKVIREAIAAQEKADEKAEQSAFHEAKPLIWLTLFSKALRIKAIAGNYPDVVDEYEWWFKGFQVCPRTQFISYREDFSIWTQDNIDSVTARRMGNEFDMALLWFDEQDALYEAERLKAIDKEQRLNAALAKLSEEDKKALGIS